MTKDRSVSCCTCYRLLLYFLLVVNIDSSVAGPIPPASLLAGARAHRYSSLKEGGETERGKRFHPFLDDQETGGTANVLDDLCRSHGDELASTSDQERIGGNPPTIDVLHEMFDPSFGLAPHISYTGQTTISNSALCNPILFSSSVHFDAIPPLAILLLMERWVAVARARDVTKHIAAGNLFR